VALLDFAHVEEVFEGEVVEYEDTREDYGEPRFVTLGMLDGRVVSVITVQRGDVIRVISFRKAVQREQELYFQGF
jgi:uncharacterized DUF497 family protein